MFKSTLFLAAGAVQEAAGTRNFDRLGGLIRALPLTGAAFLIAALALAGVPPLSGFWSEEAILATAMQHWVFAAALMVVLVLLAGTYIGRAAAATFFGEGRTPAADWPDWPMRAGMGLLAIAAVGLGALLAGQLSHVLHLTADPKPPVLWRLLAVIAAVGGLAFGAWRSSAPAFGPLPARLGAGLMIATEAPAFWTVRLASHLNLLEEAMDRIVRRLATIAGALAGMAQTVECRLDAGATRSAGGVWRMARNTEQVEARGFSRTGDAFALDLAGGGERLSLLQAGPLYFYTLALFGWATAALLVGGFMLWL